MNKHKLILLIITILTILTTKAIACEKDSSVISDDILNSIVFKPSKYGNDSIILDKVIIVNDQLDSILLNTTQYLKEGAMISFYMVFFEHDNKIYFEITGYTPKNEFLEFKKKRISNGYLREGVDVYGYLEYNKHDLYILISPSPHNVKEENIKSFFKKTEEKKVIKEKNEDEIFIYKNPLWLYEYTDKRIILLKSINDKGYFTNP